MRKFSEMGIREMQLFIRDIYNSTKEQRDFLYNKYEVPEDIIEGMEEVVKTIEYKRGRSNEITLH